MASAEWNSTLQDRVIWAKCLFSLDELLSNVKHGRASILSLVRYTWATGEARFG